MGKCQMSAFLRLDAFFKCLTADSSLTNKQTDTFCPHTHTHLPDEKVLIQAKIPLFI